MAGDRRRQRRGRAEREAADRMVQRIYIGSAAVLLLAAFAVIAGLYFTRYQPPRAHVLTVDGQSYQARDIVDRGTYAVFVEGGVPSISDVARSTVDKLIEDAALRSQGPLTVEPVTDQDVEQALLVELGLIPDPNAVDTTQNGSASTDATATATETPTETPTATPTATAEPTASPTVDPKEFADALTKHLREIDLSRDELNQVIEARLYRDRLRDHFKEQVGTSGPQLHLGRIRTSTQLAAETVIQDLAGGADFATLATEQSVATGDGAGGDLGWKVLDLLDADVQAALKDLGPGEVSAVVPSGVFFDVYQVVEVADDREYDAGVQTQLANQLLDQWLTTATAAIKVERDLSASEESWINDHVLARVTARLGG